MPLSPYPEVDALIAQLQRECLAALGSKLLGLYLYGSLVTGGFDLDISDIDFIAVISAPLTNEEFEGLSKMHSIIASRFPAWHNRVEVVYVPLWALESFRTKRSSIWVISPGEPFHEVDAGMDWLVNWYMVRTAGVPLHGPAANELIPPVSREEFLDSLREHALSWPEWIEKYQSRPAQGYAILTRCRELCAIATGEQVSKAQAADWVARELPEWESLVREAQDWRRRHREVVSHSEAAALRPRTREFMNTTADMFRGKPY